MIGYSLACEHTLGDMLVWNGNYGETFFYQAEFPYDVTQQNYGDMGYTGYRVGDNVTTHYGYGLGVYSYFRDHAVRVASGIVVPEHPNVFMNNCLTVFLNGLGDIEHVINTTGGTSRTGQSPNYVCFFEGGQGQSPDEFLQ